MPDANRYYEHASDLLATFGAKHQEIDQVRDVVRQRTFPREEMTGKRLITVRQARGIALLFQVQAFFERAATKITVREEVNTKRAQAKTAEQEKWLGGVSDMVASRSGFVYSDGIWHGLESGEMILGLSFNPHLARQGRFPLQPKAIDPRTAAYEWTGDGLGCFVIEETKPVGVVYRELFGRKAKGGKKSSVSIPAKLERLAREYPTEEIVCRWYYDDEYEYYWVDAEHVWTLPHHMPGGVPVHVGYFYHIPSTLPKERGRGMIAPILDLLQEEETLYDMYATDTELGSRPLVIYFDQHKNMWVIGRAAPGNQFNAPLQVPPKEYTAAPSFQLLTQLANMLNEQIEINTIPKAALQGPTTQLSGFALSLYNEPIKARLNMLRPFAELCLSSHYELMLKAYKKFASGEMASVIGKGNAEEYQNSFAVSVALGKGKGSKKAEAWLSLSPDDIAEQPQVKVSLNPDLPTDKGAQMQQFDLAMRSGSVPRKWGWENILEVDDPDTMEQEWKNDWLLQNDEVWKAFMKDKFKKDLTESDKELRTEFETWGEVQAEQPEPMEQGAPPPVPSPMEFSQQLLGAQSQGAPPLPVGPGLPSAATFMPPGAPVPSPLEFQQGV